MHKKNLLLILAIIVAIVAAMSLNGGGEDSTADEVFKFPDFTITCPAGSHYENQTNGMDFFTDDSSSPVLSVHYHPISVMEFDQFVKGSELLNNEQILGVFNSDNLFKISDNYTINDYNITEFKNHTVIDIYLRNNGTDSIFHVIKVSDNKVLLVDEINPDYVTAKMYNSITFN